jgi:hypothetical protein
MAQSQNRILNALPQNIFAAVEPHLKHVNLAFGTVVAGAGVFDAKVLRDRVLSEARTAA